MSKETLRQDQVQMILGAGHPDIQKTALFLNLFVEGQNAAIEYRWAENQVDPVFKAMRTKESSATIVADVT